MEIKYEKNQIENYVSDILTLGLCKLFLPVSFIYTKEEIIAVYNSEGYKRLSKTGEMSTEDILTLAISLFIGMWEAEKHYIFFDEYDINQETVFIDKGCTQAKMIFIPSTEEKTGPEKILDLLEEIKYNGNEEGRKYIENAISFIKTDDFGYQSIIRYLESLRKEVYLCGID